MPPFAPGVVREPPSGQDGDLLAAQPWDSATAIGRQACLLGSDPRAARTQKVADLLLGVHDAHRRSLFDRLGDPPSNPFDRDSQSVGMTACLEAVTNKETDMSETKTWF